MGSERAISRILSAPGLLFARRRASFICAARTRDAFRFRGTEAGHFIRPLFGLAPDGVYRASSLARTSGGLLPHLFTLAGAPARSEPAGWHTGGLFSVALSVGTPRGVAARVYPAPVHEGTGGLRGIAPCGVRTFLPRNRVPGAMLRSFRTRRESTRGRFEVQTPGRDRPGGSKSPAECQGAKLAEVLLAFELASPEDVGEGQLTT